MTLIPSGKEAALYGMIFCSALFLAISISPPAFHFNDEWITANQLHQLGISHQVITSEGKYGTFIGNQNTEYFSSRANILGYSLFLPLLSLPAYYTFTSLDQGFRLAVLLVWALLLIIIALLALTFFPDHCKILSIPWPWILIIIAVIGFIWNLRLFTPFAASGPLDPVEAAALIFTDHLLFAFLAVTLFFTCRLLCTDPWYSIFGVTAILSSSSYLYWASSAKDHMLVSVIFALNLSLILLMIKKDDYRYGVLPFVGCGLLAWVRPELGFVFFICTGMLFFYHFLIKQRSVLSPRQVFIILLIPLCVLAGSIPFFINNSLITGDPLTPPYTYMVKQSSSARPVDPVIQGEIGSAGTEKQSDQSSGLFQDILHYFQPQWNTLVSDLYHILLFPSNGMIGVLAVCPLFLIGIGLLVMQHLLPDSGRDYTLDPAIIVCIMAILSVFIAYISGFHGMIISEGIGPDMRYLSPVYIPGGLLGILGIRQLSWFQKESSTLLKNTAGTIICVVPILFIGFLLFPPIGGGFSGYTQMVTICALSLSGVFLLIQGLRHHFSMPIFIDHIILGTTLAFPLTWNLLIVIMFSVTRGNGYEFWLPVVEHLYNLFIIPVG